MIIDRPGYYAGASDLVPIAAGLRAGMVLVAPLWSPNDTTAEYRVFVIHGDTTVSVEGTSVRAVKVDERRRSDRGLVATWYLLRDSPYMVYGEVPLPDGRVQRMTEVEVPLRREDDSTSSFISTLKSTGLTMCESNPATFDLRRSSSFPQPVRATSNISLPHH